MNSHRHLLTREHLLFAESLASDPDTAIVATDGSSTGKRGAGGWAFFCYFRGGVDLFGGGEAQDATNNSMELMAVLKALSFVQQGIAKQIVVLTDSTYVMGIMSSPETYVCADENVKNYPLARGLSSIILRHYAASRIILRHVPGHTGHVLNELVDVVAKAEKAKHSHESS